jgi:integrase
MTERAGIGHWHPHELRHSAASLLSASDVPIEQIADLLGHASIRMTSLVYRHRVATSISAAVLPMERLFGS